MKTIEKLTTSYLKSRVYMGHLCFNSNGKKMTWQKLSNMDGLYNCSIEVMDNDKKGTIAQTVIYTIIDK
jgi:hypothetical protein